jgi:glycosyltransferase involved in cell wall biosynthesis
MRKLLLIAFAYPPVEIVGAVRPAALAKYLPALGWEPVILTPRVEGATRSSKLIIETDYRDVLEELKARFGLDRKRGLHEQLNLSVANRPGFKLPHTRFLEWMKYFLTYPDPFKGWTPFAIAAVEEVRSQNLGISAIVTTSPPVSCHIIGRQAKAILKCPWIADLRDLWTQNLGDDTPHFLETGLEKRTLGAADALVTVSDPWAKRLQKRYPKQKIWSITNGFDPDDFRSAAPPLTRDFTITYTGQLYQGQRDPTLLFEAVRDMLKEGSIPIGDLRIRFYGTIEPWLPALVEKFGMTPMVELHGHTPRKEVFERQRESQLLLLLPWSDPSETGHHSAKLFEYLAAGRPVLAVGGSRGVLTQTLGEANVGVHALSKAQVRDYLIRAYADYKKQGCVPYSENRQAIDQYSHPEMARRFAQVLDDVTSAKHD